VTRFQPLALLANPHLQTLIASQMSLAPEPASEQREVELPDGDRLVCHLSTPAGFDPDAGTTVVLVHGLSGSHRSSYMRRLAGKLAERGVRAVRLDLRDTGAGEGLARRAYHGGCSEDVLVVARQLRAEGQGRLVLVGFSLGGNIVLKLAGELGSEGPRLVDHVAAICPAADLLNCAERIRERRNRLYEWVFVKECRALAERRHARFPELGPVDLPAKLRLREFDDLYMAPQWGFADAFDYYRRASARPHVPNIRVRANVLLADDDPIVAPDVLDPRDLPSCVRLERSARGGHLGFLGRAPDHGVQWMDLKLFEWLGIEA
jgi:predicted alpha/beta-fold hydrolase